MSSLPVGECVPSVSEVHVPRRVDYEGEYIALSPLNPERDAPGLFACSHGTEVVEQLWTYMAYGPFEDVSSIRTLLHSGAFRLYVPPKTVLIFKLRAQYSILKA